METAIVSRNTKYCQAIETTLGRLGHATNNDILVELRKSYPGLSATTVHRATSRLASRGSIAVAPPAQDGSMRYDANTEQHDHFMCANCGMLRDTDIKDAVAPIVESSIGDGCSISGRLIISGTCKSCAKGT